MSRATLLDTEYRGQGTRQYIIVSAKILEDNTYIIVSPKILKYNTYITSLVSCLYDRLRPINVTIVY
jgi:hypothetical protein